MRRARLTTPFPREGHDRERRTESEGGRANGTALAPPLYRIRLADAGGATLPQSLQQRAQQSIDAHFGTVLSRFVHDFSRIPVHATKPSAAARIESALSGWAQTRAGRELVEDVQSAPARAFAGSGVQLDQRLQRDAQIRFQQDFSQVRLHADESAAGAAAALGARAFTAGRAIAFGRGHYQPNSEAGRRLLAHELAHVVQQRGRQVDLTGALHVSRALEADADARADAFVTGRTMETAPPTTADIAPNLEEKILRYGVKWLSKRTVKTVSKHVAKHAGRIAGKAIHSIFKSPKNIRSLLELTTKEAIELAAKHPRATGEVLEEGGLKIVRQASGTPGKFRLLVQKTFEKAIGTKGEKILRVILDQSGRIVTAFPADRLTTIGITAGGLALLESRMADAAEGARADAAAEDAREADKSAFEWQDFIPIIGDLWGGSLNEGESEILRERDALEALLKDIIAEVEFTEQRSLDAKARAELEELVRVGIALPLMVNAGVDVD